MTTQTTISTQTRYKTTGPLPPLLRLLIIATQSCTSAHLTSVQRWESARLHAAFKCNIIGRTKGCIRKLASILSRQKVNIIIKSFFVLEWGCYFWGTDVIFSVSIHNSNRPQFWNAVAAIAYSLHCTKKSKNWLNHLIINQNLHSSCVELSELYQHTCIPIFACFFVVVF